MEWLKLIRRRKVLMSTTLRMKKMRLRRVLTTEMMHQRLYDVFLISFLISLSFFWNISQTFLCCRLKLLRGISMFVPTSLAASVRTRVIDGNILYKYYYNVSLKVTKYHQPYTINSYLLLRHMKSHSEERPHKCSVCERGFKTIASLQNHVNMHNGVKPHVCKYCKSPFTTSGENN